MWEENPGDNEKRTDESFNTTEMLPVLDACPQVKLDCTADVLGSSSTQEANENNFVLELYGPVNNEVMSSWSVNSGTIPGQA